MGSSKKYIKNKKALSPVSYGDFVLPPVTPGSSVNELCDKIDNFYYNYPQKHKGQKPSDLIKGAFYAIRLECRSNPDWMSQAANSMREVIYPLIRQGADHNLIKLFQSYAVDEKSKIKKFNKEFIDTFDNLHIVYRQMSDIAHHGVAPTYFLEEKDYIDLSNDGKFKKIIENAVSVIWQAFSFQQIYIHNVVDLIIQEKLSGKTKKIKDDLELILKSNLDAYQYFFNKADKNWLIFLRDNGFLDAIKKPADDKNQYFYTMPELQYLVNISEQDPVGVVNFMLDVPVSDENFNPEVISRFAYICSSLPKEQLARMIPKIKKDGWIQLMEKFNSFGFEYKQMLEKLAEAKDWKNFLILTRAVLAVRPKEKVTEETFGTENPFYFKDLGEIKIFEYLAKIDDENLEEALKLVSEVMKKIVPNKKRKSKSEIFEVEDSFGLFDVDFFTLELEDDSHSSYRDDVKNLAAVMKKLIERLFAKNSSKPEVVKYVYIDHVKTLPASRSMWRFSLFVLSLHPQIFKEELKNVFFRFFEENKNGYDLILGAEYEQALKKGFSVLSGDDKKKFIEKVVEYFSRKREDEKDEFWHKVKGREILACIFSELDQNEKSDAEEKLEGKILEEFQPEPSIVSGGMAGFISAKAPVTLEDLQKLEISEIVSNLCEKWSPKNLRELDTEKDFMNPLNADGMGNLLKQDIIQRFKEYVDSAELFFKRDVLDQHYTHSFLQGIHDVLRENKSEKEGVDFGKLLILIENIVKSDSENNFPEDTDRRKEFDAWVVGWKSVFYSMADVIKELLGEGKSSTMVDFSAHRGQLLFIIKHLLTHQSPGLEKNTEKEGGEPFFVAINSVRGRAFQALVLFIYRDGEDSSKKGISKEVKNIYEETLKNEKTYAIMFLYGHYLPSFYYRDKKWIASLMPKIFSADENKLDLYLAAWEGYLAANIYGDMFSEFNDLYKRAIELNPNNYTKRKYFKDLDEGLAIHLALAFVHFPDFGIDSDLFDLFWKTKNTKRHEEFISFVGRHIISNTNAAAIIQENKIDIQKIKDLWDWVLNNVEDEKVFSGFGFWIDKEQGFFDDSKWLAEHIARTLEKSKGQTNWDYGLIKSVSMLARQAPEETVRILKAYLLECCLNKPDSFRNTIYVNDFFEAFQLLYQNSETRDTVYELINELIEKGGSRFWKLEEVINREG